jgi:hypothetical protein
MVGHMKRYHILFEIHLNIILPSHPDIKPGQSHSGFQLKSHLINVLLSSTISNYKISTVQIAQTMTRTQTSQDTELKSD